MSSPIGTSAELAARDDRRLRAAAAAVCTALIAVLLGGAPFTTVDASGFHRLGTARLVWQTASARLSAVLPAPLMTVVYAACAITVGGAFALLWLAAAVGGESAADLPAVASARRDEPQA